MSNPEIEEFAKLLVRFVRDETIRRCDALLKPQANSKKARRWKSDGATGALEGVIPDIVDETIFSLLMAIDEGGLRLKFVSESDTDIDLTEVGGSQLAGWYAGGMWPVDYSTERWIDDYLP